jgi:hypothetical protein
VPYRKEGDSGPVYYCRFVFVLFSSEVEDELMSATAVAVATDQAIQTFTTIYDTWKARQAHPVATEWVAAIQAPFGSNLALIVDAKDSALAYKVASAHDVYYAQQGVIQLWTNYQRFATEFAQNGPRYAQVIENSYRTLTPIITQIVKDMDNQINQLGGVSGQQLGIATQLGLNTGYSPLWWLLGALVLFVLVFGFSIRRK